MLLTHSDDLLEHPIHASCVLTKNDCSLNYAISTSIPYFVNALHLQGFTHEENPHEIPIDEEEQDLVDRFKYDSIMLDNVFKDSGYTPWGDN